MEKSVFDVGFAECEEAITELFHVAGFLCFGAVVDVFPIEGRFLQHDLWTSLVFDHAWEIGGGGGVRVGEEQATYLEP